MMLFVKSQYAGFKDCSNPMQIPLLQGEMNKLQYTAWGLADIVILIWLSTTLSLIRQI